MSYLSILYEKFIEAAGKVAERENPVQVQPAIEGLDENGNVPMVEPVERTPEEDSPIPMTDQVSFSSKPSAPVTSETQPVVAEKPAPVSEETPVAAPEVTADTEVQSTQSQKPENKPAPDDTFKPDEGWVKTGESIDERLSRYYAEYDKASPERKLELLEKYLTASYAELNCSEQRKREIQLADYKKLIHNTTNRESYEYLAKKIDVLERENQCPAAQSILEDGANADLRHAGGIALGETVPKLHKDNQLSVTDMLIKTGDTEIIESAAAHASELHEDNQIGAVQMYRGCDIESVDNILVSQYGKFAPDNLKDIHNIMSTSSYESVVQNIMKEIEKLPAEKRQEFYDSLAEAQLKAAKEESGKKVSEEPAAESKKTTPEETVTVTHSVVSTTETKTTAATSSTESTSTRNTAKSTSKAEVIAQKLKKMTTEQKLQLFDSYSNKVSTNTRERICENVIATFSPTQRQQAANGSYGTTLQAYVISHPDKCKISLDDVYSRGDSDTKNQVLETVQSNPFLTSQYRNTHYNSQLAQRLEEQRMQS